MANKTPHFRGKRIRDIILGGQDGLVNVLGVVLGVASATNNSFVVMVAGLAATFAETISMAAVSYTSTKAEKEYHESERKIEEDEIKNKRSDEIEEIHDIYFKKGFRGNLLNKIVNGVIAKRSVWIDTMMVEELNLPPKFSESPIMNGVVVLISTLIGSLLPLIPFFLLPVSNAIITSLSMAVVVLFAAGAIKSKLTVGNWFRSGLELSIIGTIAALSGYFVGLGLSKIFGTNSAGIG